MKPLFSVSAIITFFFFSIYQPAFAPQALAQGGKAEPLRVQFKRGRYSASYQNRLRGGAQAEYAVEAREGQRLTIHLVASPADSVEAEIKDPDGETLAFGNDRGASKSARLTKSGEYHLAIRRASSKPGTSRYTLRISIR
jgi:hypothetical protein